MAIEFKTFQCTLSLFILLLSSAHALGKIVPRFPSSIFGPEQLAQISSDESTKPYETRYFTQILDHFNFNPQIYKTFQQRYLINDKHWGGAEKKAPIFVYMGNEGEIEWFAHNTGFMFDTAPHFKALLVFIEHRFYGKSIPYGGDKEVAYNNASTLGYLSSTQALADYATLILDLKKNLSAIDSPVVVFGGSYGRMLAAWFRLKYPHVTIGALASSSPILNFDKLTSPYSFSNIITQDFRSVSESCFRVIKNSWALIEVTANQRGGLEKLRSSFNICKDTIFSADDIESWLSTAYAYASMTDYPTPSNFLKPLPAYPIKQACTEMVLPIGACNNESIFPASTYDYNDHVTYCTSVYGVKPRPHWITTEFGGFDMQRVLRRYGSNIIFFNGLRDPWSGGGVLKSISSSLVAIVAKEGAHHVDLRGSTKEDPDWLKEVRKLEINYISKWLSQYYYDLVKFS